MYHLLLCMMNVAIARQDVLDALHYPGASGAQQEQAEQHKHERYPEKTSSTLTCGRVAWRTACQVTSSPSLGD